MILDTSFNNKRGKVVRSTQIVVSDSVSSTNRLPSAKDRDCEPRITTIGGLDCLK
jgi:hypothetical protein